MSELYIGIMSGTSLDGVDAVLADFSGPRPIQISHRHCPFPVTLRDELSALCRSGADEVRRSQLAALALSRLYAELVADTLAAAGVSRHAVRAVGCHGQTIRHVPAAGYTVQLGAPALLAELVEITVVSDFRARDIAAGGQGAPLVPAFHAHVFTDDHHRRAVLNLGGMANLTLLEPGKRVRGFDCGPGNVLMDMWIERCRGDRYDTDGKWAASGRVDSALLQHMLEHPFFALAPPKSCGREQFNLEWLLSLLPVKFRAEDVQATLAWLTVQSVADALKSSAFMANDIAVCGGGAFNTHLTANLAAAAGIPVHSTLELGFPPDTVEALAFAWLARCTLEKLPGNLPEITGAKGLRVLGAIWHA